jgi:hypothetical protein
MAKHETTWAVTASTNSSTTPSEPFTLCTSPPPPSLSLSAPAVAGHRPPGPQAPRPSNKCSPPPRDGLTDARRRLRGVRLHLPGVPPGLSVGAEGLGLCLGLCNPALNLLKPLPKHALQSLRLYTAILCRNEVVRLGSNEGSNAELDIWRCLTWTTHTQAGHQGQAGRHKHSPSGTLLRATG